VVGTDAHADPNGALASLIEGEVEGAIGLVVAAVVPELPADADELPHAAVPRATATSAPARAVRVRRVVRMVVLLDLSAC
jgi:hypothetical protein